MIESEDKFRFDNMDLGDEVEEAYEARLEAEALARVEKRLAISARYRKKIESKGECEGCGCKEYLRWVHNGEVYLCQECFIHDLQCEADAGRV